MTLAGDLLQQLRTEKGYSHSRPAFVAHFGISWGEHTQRFLEVGRTLMREDLHLSHMVQIGLVKQNSALHHKFQAAIEHDHCQMCHKTTPSAKDLPVVLPRVPFPSDGETEEERLVREVFEAFQIDGLFDAMRIESPRPTAVVNAREALYTLTPINLK